MSPEIINTIVVTACNPIILACIYSLSDRYRSERAMAAYWRDRAKRAEAEIDADFESVMAKLAEDERERKLRAMIRETVAQVKQ